MINKFYYAANEALALIKIIINIIIDKYLMEFNVI